LGGIIGPYKTQGRPTLQNELISLHQLKFVRAYRDFFGNLCIGTLIVLQKCCYVCQIVLDDDIKFKLLKKKKKFFLFIDEKQVQEKPINKYKRNQA
jgi:hypothetical protein